jgi:hypothetical protein
MKQQVKKTTTTATVQKEVPAKSSGALFDRTNIQWMLIGGAVIGLGFILMAGGKSDNPAEFHPEEVYSTTRITIAPILILIGFIIEIYAIFRNPKK